MKKLFKFVGILLVGTAIGACIIANTKVDITPLKMVIKKTIEKAKNFDIVKTAKYDSASVDTIPKNLSTLERDIVTPKKAETTQEIAYSELLQKLKKEVGKEAIEDWALGRIVGESTMEDLLTWDKVINVARNCAIQEFDDVDFAMFVESQSYLGEDGRFHLKDEKPYSVKPAPKATRLKPNPKKDFLNTRYSDDFVTKYRIDKKHIKTDADRTFDIKWCRVLRQMANLMQQRTGGYAIDEKAMQYFKMLMDDMLAYQRFLSYDCLTDFTKKFEQIEKLF
jgi:hypothetical protein